MRTYVHVHVCIHVSLYIRMHGCVCIDVYVCAIYSRVYISTFTYMYVPIGIGNYSNDIIVLNGLWK